MCGGEGTAMCGEPRVAAECTCTEREVGRCARPTVRPGRKRERRARPRRRLLHPPARPVDERLADRDPRSRLAVPAGTVRRVGGPDHEPMPAGRDRPAGQARPRRVRRARRTGRRRWGSALVIDDARHPTLRCAWCHASDRAALAACRASGRDPGPATRCRPPGLPPSDGDAMAKVGSTEKVVREIRRHTRRRFSAEEKIRIVLEGLRGEESIAALCRREGLAPNLYYRWSKEFLEAGKKRLLGDTTREATSNLLRAARSCPVTSTPPIVLNRRTSPHPIPRTRGCGADGDARLAANGARRGRDSARYREPTTKGGASVVRTARQRGLDLNDLFTTLLQAPRPMVPATFKPTAQ